MPIIHAKFEPDSRLSTDLDSTLQSPYPIVIASNSWKHDYRYRPRRHPKDILLASEISLECLPGNVSWTLVLLGAALKFAITEDNGANRKLLREFPRFSLPNLLPPALSILTRKLAGNSVTLTESRFIRA